MLRNDDNAQLTDVKLIFNLYVLRNILCSGGANPAQWEDISGSTPLNFLDNCVTFTSTVSARCVLIKLLSCYIHYNIAFSCSMEVPFFSFSKCLTRSRQYLHFSSKIWQLKS